MIKKIKETFIKLLAGLVKKGANHIISEQKKELPNIESYKFMVEYLNSHYKHEAFVTGQIDQGHMEKKLSNMTFDQVKELFDSILKIKMSYKYQYINEEKTVNTKDKSTKIKTDNQGE